MQLSEEVEDVSEGGTVTADLRSGNEGAGPCKQAEEVRSAGHKRSEYGDRVEFVCC